MLEYSAVHIMSLTNFLTDSNTKYIILKSSNLTGMHVEHLESLDFWIVQNPYQPVMCEDSFCCTYYVFDDHYHQIHVYHIKITCTAFRVIRLMKRSKVPISNQTHHLKNHQPMEPHLYLDLCTVYPSLCRVGLQQFGFSVISSARDRQQNQITRRR